MNNTNEKRRELDRALKDAMVEQVWALSDDEAAQEAQQQGDDLRASIASIRAVRDKAAYVVSDRNSNMVVALKFVRSPDAVPQSPSRHRLARSQRLAANVTQPASPQSTAASKQVDQLGPRSDENTDRSKS